jgi:hypothetical protein
VGEGRGAVADGGDDFVVGVEFVDEFVRGCVGGEVEHGAVAADEEDGLVLTGFPQKLREFMRVFVDVGMVGEEGGGDGVGFEGFDGGGVEGGFAAEGGGDGYGDVVFEDFVGVGEFGLGDGS